MRGSLNEIAAGGKEKLFCQAFPDGESAKQRGGGSMLGNIRTPGDFSSLGQAPFKVSAHRSKALCLEIKGSP